MKLHLKYFIYFILLFSIECCIALFTQHSFIRGFVGDVLVIPLLFFFIKSLFFNFSNYKILVGILLFATMIEFLQLFNFYRVENLILQTVLGATFDVWDLVAYGVGGILITFFNKINNKYI